MGVAHHDPSSGALAFFPPRQAAPSLSDEERSKLDEGRRLSLEQLEQRRKFGASGGMQPNALTPDEVQARSAVEREEQRRIARQNASARAARATLDARKGAA
jgi:hypothetical protein